MYKEILEKCVAKIEAENERIGYQIPYTTNEEGMYDIDWVEKDLAWWTNGFWGGIQWLAYQIEQKETFKTTGEMVEKNFDRLFLEGFEGIHHDVGFMWLHTAVANYRQTGDKLARTRGIHAANILSARYNANGNYLVAWNHDFGWMIIDSLMNIPILFWATEETGDERFRSIALKHADTALEHILRPDGSVKHIVEFDPITGEYITSHGGQGYKQGSSWSRGQSWAIYGMALLYKKTGEEKFLEASRRVADYFISQIVDTGYVSEVDFRSEADDFILDTTATAIAASGIIEMAEGIKEPKEAKKYMDIAKKMIAALDEKHCDYDTAKDSILQNASECYHPQDGFQERPIIYGDYFYMEAVMKLAGYKMNMW